MKTHSKLWAVTVARTLWQPAAVYLPVTAVLAFLAFAYGPPPWLVLALIAAGVGLWTLFEYWLHRSILHMLPRGRVRRYIAGLHVLHHRDPIRHPGTVLLWVSATVAALMFGAMTVLLGAMTAAALMAGVVIGYLGYEYVHLALHVPGAPPLPWGRLVRAHHMAHHEQSARHNFAIVLPVWDRVFRTRIPQG